MNKSQELEVLADAIAKLGPDSYLGPWLASVAGEVEHSIRSDFFPTCSIKETTFMCGVLRDEAKKVVVSAREQAAQIVQAARAEASRVAKQAEEDRADSLRKYLGDLDRAIHVLQDLKLNR